MFEYKEILLTADHLLSLLGSGVILYAGFRAFYLFCVGALTGRLDLNRLRLDFGYGIILGLEFMIGADIIESMAKPTYYDLGVLAVLVVVRTFLSYFLNKELAELKPGA